MKNILYQARPNIRKLYFVSDIGTRNTVTIRTISIHVQIGGDIKYNSPPQKAKKKSKKRIVVLKPPLKYLLPDSRFE